MRDYTYVHYALTNDGKTSNHIYIITSGWVNLQISGECMVEPPESPVKTAIEIWSKLWKEQMTLEDFISQLGL